MTSPAGIGSKSAARRDRQIQALDLRRQGLGYKVIADRIGTSQREAYLLVKTALADLRSEARELAEEVRELELDRLDRLLAVAMAIHDDEDRSPKIRMEAQDRILRISQRRAALLGLDKTEAAATDNRGGLLAWLTGKAIGGDGSDPS